MKITLDNALYLKKWFFGTYCIFKNKWWCKLTIIFQSYFANSNIMVIVFQKLLVGEYRWPFPSSIDYFHNPVEYSLKFNCVIVKLSGRIDEIFWLPLLKKIDCLWRTPIHSYKRKQLKVVITLIFLALSDLQIDLLSEKAHHWEISGFNPKSRNVICLFNKFIPSAGVKSKL